MSVSIASTLAPRRSSIPRRSATSRPFQYSGPSRPGQEVVGHGRRRVRRTVLCRQCHHRSRRVEPPQRLGRGDAGGTGPDDDRPHQRPAPAPTGDPARTRSDKASTALARAEPSSSRSTEGSHSTASPSIGQDRDRGEREPPETVDMGEHPLHVGRRRGPVHHQMDRTDAQLVGQYRRLHAHLHRVERRVDHHHGGIESPGQRAPEVLDPGVGVHEHESSAWRCMPATVARISAVSGQRHPPPACAHPAHDQEPHAVRSGDGTAVDDVSGIGIEPQHGTGPLPGTGAGLLLDVGGVVGDGHDRRRGIETDPERRRRGSAARPRPRPRPRARAGPDSRARRAVSVDLPTPPLPTTTRRLPVPCVWPGSVVACVWPGSVVADPCPPQVSHTGQPSEPAAAPTGAGVSGGGVDVDGGEPESLALRLDVATDQQRGRGRVRLDRRTWPRPRRRALRPAVPPRAGSRRSGAGRRGRS